MRTLIRFDGNDRHFAARAASARLSITARGFSGAAVPGYDNNVIEAHNMPARFSPEANRRHFSCEKSKVSGARPCVRAEGGRRWPRTTSIRRSDLPSVMLSFRKRISAHYVLNTGFEMGLSNAFAVGRR